MSTEFKLKKLKPIHLRVIDEYFQNGRNQRAAMRACGYSESTVRKSASQFFKSGKVAAEIQRRERELAERFEINRNWIVERLARIADSGKTLSRFKRIDENGNIYWDFRGATQEDLEVISDLTVEEYKEGRGPGSSDVKKTKISVNSPLQALEALARMFGYNQDKLKVEGDLTVVEQLQAGRQRIHQLRHGPRNVAEVGYSEIAAREIELRPNSEGEYVPLEEQQAVEPLDELEW